MSKLLNGLIDTPEILNMIIFSAPTRVLYGTRLASNNVQEKRTTIKITINVLE